MKRARGLSCADEEAAMEHFVLAVVCLLLRDVPAECLGLEPWPLHVEDALCACGVNFPEDILNIPAVFWRNVRSATASCAALEVLDMAKEIQVSTCMRACLRTAVFT